jgi:hypothetical protein
MPGRLIFSTTADGASTPTERMRLDSSGRLGLGTSSPGTNLHIAGTGNARATIESTNSANADILFTTAGTLRGVIGYNSTAGGLNLDYGRGTGPLTFSYVGAEVARFDASGRLGIGSASPPAELSVTSGTNLAYPTQVNAQLHINKSTGAAGLLIASDTISNIFFADAAASNVGRIYYDHSSDFLAIHTNSTERARIDSSGRLLVGTSSDSGGALFQVNGNRIRVATAKTPSSASDTGTAGEICWDADYIYVCTATNTWKRTAISTWP